MPSVCVQVCSAEDKAAPNDDTYNKGKCVHARTAGIECQGHMWRLKEAMQTKYGQGSKAAHRLMSARTVQSKSETYLVKSGGK